MSTIDLAAPAKPLTTAEPAIIDPGNPSTTPEAPARARRLVGIDIARGIALIGMFTQHVFISGPDGESSTGWVEWVFRESAGRASVLFFVLSGVSLSLIHAKGSPSASTGALVRRGTLLLFGGILLTDAVWGGSILQHYGLAFLLAPLLLRLRGYGLGALSAVGMVGGPVFLLFARNWGGDVRGLWTGRTGEWIIGQTWDLLVGGVYPMVLWIGFFTFGMLLGRLDLRNRATLLRTLAVALAVVFAVGIGAAQLTERYGDAAFGDGIDSASSGEVLDETTFDESAFDDDENWKKVGDEWKFIGDESLLGDFDELDDVDRPADWKELYGVGGHSGHMGWTLQTSALAVAIMSAALLLPRFASRALAPLAWMGSMSLTAYFIHIVLVNDVFDRFFAEAGLSVIAQEWIVLGLIGVMVVSCTIFRFLLPAGPCEWVLKKFTVPTSKGSVTPSN